MGTLILNETQQRRAEILTRTASGQFCSIQTAQLLGVSERQVRRLLASFLAKGLPSVVHGNCARPPVNKTAEELKQRIKALAGPGGAYHDFNACHLRQLLAEREGIQIGRSTLDRLLKTEKLRKPRHQQARRLFRRRERCPREGQMLQIDASPHAWLEGRAPTLCLIGAVDDATSRIVHLRFWPTECLAGYFYLAREIAIDPRFGLPEAFYHDKHTILRSPKEPSIEDELAGREPRSQFQQVLAQLGIEGIAAQTPQAKGRIERMWQTLQDRLIKEMRLAGLRTLEQANAFLPDFIARYNAEFAVQPAEAQAAWVPVDLNGLDLAYYFATREQRTVRSDHTLCWFGTTLQVQRSKTDPSLAGKRVSVHATPEGELHLYLDRQRLAFTKVSNTVTAAPRTAAPRTAAPIERTEKKTTLSPEQRRTSRRKQMALLHTGV